MAKTYSRYHTYIKPVLENQLVRSVAPYVFSLVMIAILTAFALRPTLSTILNLQKTLQNNQEILKGLEKKGQDLTLGKQNLDNLPSQTKLKIERALPQKPEIPLLLSSLQKSSLAIASGSALQVQPLTLVDNTKASQGPLLTLGEIDFSYNLQGSFGQILVVLQDLNQAERMVSLTSVVVSKPAEGQTVLSVSGKAYYLK